jgi:hypothetical protein
VFVKNAIDKLRKLIRNQKYEISIHANEEMSKDALLLTDVENAILTGKITKRFTRDERGVRYEVTGESADGRPVAVVCRIIGTGWLRIITVFALENN